MQHKCTYLTFEQQLLHRTFAAQFGHTQNAVIVDFFFDNQGVACSSHWALPDCSRDLLNQEPNKELILEQIENLLRYRINLGFPASQGARISYFDNRVTINWLYENLLEQYPLIESISLLVRVVSCEREEDLDVLSQNSSETATIHCQSLWEPYASVSVMVRREHAAMHCLFDHLKEAKNRNGVVCVKSNAWQQGDNDYLLFDATFCPLEISVEEFEAMLSEVAA